MKKIILVLLVLGLLVLSGCYIELNPDYAQETSDQENYVKFSDIIPPKVDKVDIESKKYDCSKPENFNITYVNIEIKMDFTDESLSNPNYIWYPSLNEGRINWISMFGYNWGCTKIKLPVLQQIYIVHNGKTVFYNEGYDTFSLSDTGSDFAYPNDLVIQINPMGQINLIVNEKGIYEIIVVVSDKETKNIIGAGKTEFQIS